MQPKSAINIVVNKLLSNTSIGIYILQKVLLYQSNIDFYLKPNVFTVSKFAKGQFVQSAVISKNIT